ncbi:MAG TPA: BON domain-containing protein [Thermoanaerobaculia bacterium]|nr:BON domain-containing protein [Thermoanaerobaculia bacterium]
MKTRELHKALAFCLGLTILPFAGCQQRDVVDAERDADGDTRIHVDGDAVDSNFEQAEQQFDRAGEEIKEGAQQVGAAVQEGAEQLGDAVQEGAERIEAEVGPVAREVLSDAGITAKVKARLVADPEVNPFHIDVDTVDGRVTLNGKVRSEDVRAEAEKLASRTEGVKSVVNLIQVAGQEPPAPPETGR